MSAVDLTTFPERLARRFHELSESYRLELDPFSQRVDWDDLGTGRRRVLVGACEGITADLMDHLQASVRPLIRDHADRAEQAERIAFLFHGALERIAAGEPAAQGVARAALDEARGSLHDG